jgi:sulfotransferase
MKTINFISGLPRSGTTLITKVLDQNPQIHGEAVSTLATMIASVHANWDVTETHQEYPNYKAKAGAIKGMINGYYDSVDKPIIFDKDRAWLTLIPLLEEIFQKEVRILVCVRNPAEILTSFEKLRRENPLFYTKTDFKLREGSSIASRAYYYANPDGALGMTHRNIKDAITSGYLDRMLFVDYNKYCSMPKGQTKRIYDFFEIPGFEHNFEKIEQREDYNDLAVGLPDLHKIKPSLSKTTVNCVEYLGLDLFEQYNREIFWNAWI